MWVKGIGEGDRVICLAKMNEQKSKGILINKKLFTFLIS